MRVLLDECLPRRLTRELVGHEVQTVPEAGWAGRKNGDLLLLIPGRFEAFITIDRNLVFQHGVKGLQFGVVVLHAHTNRMVDLLPLVPRILEVMARIRQGEIVSVGR